MGNRIPKPPQKEQRKKIPVPQKVFSTERTSLTFSFELLERTEYFNLDGTCSNWSSELFDMLKDVSTHSVVELTSGKYKKYRVHNHETAKSPSPLPKGVALNDCYQIRLSTSKGGIHGVFSGNVFYVIWLDPLHNMYPDDRFGGLRKVKSPSTCCKDRDEEILRLQDQIKELKEENKLYKEIYD